jgi:hypothetical protein
MSPRLNQGHLEINYNRANVGNGWTSHSWMSLAVVMRVLRGGATAERSHGPCRTHNVHHEMPAGCKQRLRFEAQESVSGEYRSDPKRQGK